PLLNYYLTFLIFREIMIILIWLPVYLSYLNITEDGIQEKKWFDAWLLYSLYFLLVNYKRYEQFPLAQNNAKQ
ncbi:hypothetical protein ACJX0J_038444, partial [Zea mays]